VAIRTENKYIKKEYNKSKHYFSPCFFSPCFFSTISGRLLSFVLKRVVMSEFYGKIRRLNYFLRYIFLLCKSLPLCTVVHQFVIITWCINLTTKKTTDRVQSSRIQFIQKISKFNKSVSLKIKCYSYEKISNPYHITIHNLINIVLCQRIGIESTMGIFIRGFRRIFGCFEQTICSCYIVVAP